MATHPLWRPYEESANQARQSVRVARRQVEPQALQAHDERWAADYAWLEERIRGALEPMDLRHVGSTAIPGLIAKPVVDLDLVVADVEDEDGYLAPLESIGFRLIFRDPIGADAHRQLTYAEPNANLHVWSVGAVEPQRHRLFVDWLKENAADRDMYAAAKREAARARGARRYNDVKSAVVYDIYERIFSVDPDHPHDPRPR